MSRFFISAERTTAQKRTAAANQLSLVTADLLLPGFQIYTNVEWVVNRSRVFKTFAVFTGRNDHVARVTVVEFRADLQSVDYEDSIQKAFAQFEQDGLKMRETPQGVIMTGNPEWFSKASSTCILVPEGDYDTHLPELFVNINLRRFGCGERSLLSYRPPSQAVSDKFYRVTGIAPSEDQAIGPCVLSLGHVAHEALVMLSLLEKPFEDGLICDTTQAAFKRFYNEFGPFNDVDIGQGSWTDPMLITAALRVVERLKHKLAVLGHAVKPGNEVSNELGRQIKHFQKSQGLKPTQVFDRKTIERIDALYVRVPAPAQAVAAVSTTVNVLRSTIENMTGLPTGSHRRGDEVERDGPNATPGYSVSGDHDLEYFYATWMKRNKRMEKIQNRKKDKRNRGEGVGASIGGTDAFHTSIRTSASLPSSNEKASGGLAAASPSPSTLLNEGAGRPTGQLPTSQSWVGEDGDDDGQGKHRHGPGRMLRGIKDSTSRTIGGIVDKSKRVRKGMKQLANVVMEGGVGLDFVESETDEEYPPLEASSALTRTSFDERMLYGGETGPDSIDGGVEDMDHLEEMARGRGRTTQPLADGSGFPARKGAAGRRALSLDASKGLDVSSPGRNSARRERLERVRAQSPGRALADPSSPTSASRGQSLSLMPEDAEGVVQTPSGPSVDNVSQSSQSTGHTNQVSVPLVLRRRSTFEGGLTIGRKLSIKEMSMRGSPASAVPSTVTTVTPSSVISPASTVSTASPQSAVGSATPSTATPSTATSVRANNKHFSTDGKRAATSTSSAPPLITLQRGTPTQLSLASTAPSLNDAPLQPLAPHPKIEALTAGVTRRLNHLTHTLKTTIPPLIETLNTQSDTIAQRLAEQAAKATAMRAALEELVERQKEIEARVESVETESSRVNYAVGVCEDRVRETEEAALGVLGRVHGVERWWRRKGQGQGVPETEALPS
ncbi:uncharacterized protein EV422DRAFT_569061 [Fimicolochytrium jonesii]|uniref:uncharacterized protein n=1 Tax=Fimicolochytrium jonesii TaxID=1396493 RepID=UPI0022FDB99F|nr:uncharacterized protein EV422DRAFT_569061 [Fimicolochytrium jonesii]KAI8819183.1 hypothetical protein EV422DRAFT_569061 [Fimicolochytrium jonesii]